MLLPTETVRAHPSVKTCIFCKYFKSQLYKWAANQVFLLCVLLNDKLCTNGSLLHFLCNV